MDPVSHPSVRDVDDGQPAPESPPHRRKCTESGLAAAGVGGFGGLGDKGEGTEQRKISQAQTTVRR